MTANREKPEQLTFFFFEEMPKPTKGTIYLDTSKKGVTKFKTRRHNSYRAEVTYNGVKYRKRPPSEPIANSSWLNWPRSTKKACFDVLP